MSEDPSCSYIPIEEKDFNCGICYVRLEDPVIVCWEGHLSCGTCIKQWSKNNRSCPFCRTNLLQQFITCRSTSTILQSIIYLCPNTQYGCTWKSPWKNMKNHGSTCVYALVVCPYMGCIERLPKIDLYKHLWLCKYRPTDSQPTTLRSCCIPPDLVHKSVDEVCEAANKGDSKSLVELGICYEHGIGMERSSLKAFECYQQAANMNNCHAICNLGICYQNGIGTEVNHEKALAQFQIAAEDYGYSRAQFLLAVYYSTNKHMKRDIQKAIKWCTAAADQGDILAQSLLGVFYETGLGMESDKQIAIEWYRKAAKQGLDFAQYVLGRWYRIDEGVEPDVKEAAKWFQKGAVQGNPDAQWSLGISYEYGEGVDCDIQSAVQWYCKAAEQGHAHAQMRLGLCYKYGKGVDRNMQDARKWLQRAADQGDIGAQEELQMGM